MLQAQQLDEIEPFKYGIDFVIADRQALRGQAQTLHGIGVVHAGGQRIDAGDVDEDA
jgi:hypothetical protein